MTLEATLDSTTNAATLLVALAPLLAWLRRLWTTQPLVLDGRRSGRIFRFELHNTLPVAFTGDVELVVEVLDEGGAFEAGVEPVLLCGPRTGDLVAKLDGDKTFTVTAKKVRPFATWTVVCKCNQRTSRVQATLSKPNVTTVVASEQENLPRVVANRWWDFAWAAVAVAGYGLLAWRSESWVGGFEARQGAPSEFRAYGSLGMCTDGVLGILLLAMIGFAYQFCVRTQPPPVLLQGYVGLGVDVPRDDDQSLP
jgi:hypothetical protein